MNMTEKDKRFYAACAALTGLFAAGISDIKIVPRAWEYADALLASEFAKSTTKEKENNTDSFETFTQIR